MNDRIGEKFQETFGTSPILVRSPGRINLIGEHTDYNMGYVLPAAIDSEITFALAPSKKDEIVIHALDLGEVYQVKLSSLKPSTEPLWPNYLLGVVAELQKRGYSIGGFNCMFGGNIPIGAGLSSSAALECGLTLGLSQLFTLDIKQEELIQIAQQAEHSYTGVMCGIMDQFACTYGREGHVIRLDCRTLEYEYFPITNDRYKMILLDSVVKHSLASSEYNTRRDECNKSIKVISRSFPSVTSLRDCTPEMIATLKYELGATLYNRSRYVTEENKRVEEACTLLSAGDIEGVGKLMNDSHDGLSNLYEVSCEELDFLQAYAMGDSSVLGSRMMGGGFGGCTINIVNTEEENDFVERIKNAYFERFNLELKSYSVSIANGVSVLS